LRRLGLNLALALASIAVLLGLLEAAARVARRGRGGGRESSPLAQYVVADPELGWRKQPGARAVYRQREFTVEVTINSHGLRDAERSYAAPPGVFRLLALGDSFVEGYSVPFERTVTQVLEANLRRPGCPVEVLNGGTAGYSTDQEYLFYRQEGSRYSPNVVMLFFYYNDVVLNGRDSYYGRPKPRLVFREGKLEAVNVPLPRPAARAPVAAAPEHKQRSALLEWVRERLQRGAPRAYNELAVLGLWPRMEAEAPGEELRVYKKGPTPRIDGAWHDTFFILQALAREVEARGARLLVVHVPNRMEVSDRDRELTRIAYGMDDQGWDPGRVRERLVGIGGRIGFPVLDLAPALRAEEGPWSGPYYAFDPHWNALGHRVAARQLGMFLRERGWLPPCAQVPR
jgi:lysophospholipase L1-like esterase